MPTKVDLTGMRRTFYGTPPWREPSSLTRDWKLGQSRLSPHLPSVPAFARIADKAE
jgi:hypothetical protein